jgi:hypothetical protein
MILLTQLCITTENDNQPYKNLRTRTLHHVLHLLMLVNFHIDGQSEAVTKDKRKTDNIMVNRKRTKRQANIHKALNRK